MKIRATYSPRGNYGYEGPKENGYIIAFVGTRQSALAIFVKDDGSMLTDSPDQFKIDSDIF